MEIIFLHYSLTRQYLHYLARVFVVENADLVQSDLTLASAAALFLQSLIVLLRCVSVCADSETKLTRLLNRTQSNSRVSEAMMMAMTL